MYIDTSLYTIKHGRQQQISIYQYVIIINEQKLRVREEKKKKTTKRDEKSVNDFETRTYIRDGHVLPTQCIYACITSNSNVFKRNLTMIVCVDR